MKVMGTMMVNSLATWQGLEAIVDFLYLRLNDQHLFQDVRATLGLWVGINWHAE